MRTGSDFYVYELVDPRNGEVFYVGKGRGARDRSHMRQARLRRFANPEKDTRILAILAAGEDVLVRRVAEALSERDAFRQERDRIAEHGIASLTNITPGNLTDIDRAESMARDGLAMMGRHLLSALYGGTYTAQDIRNIFMIIRELRQSLGELNTPA